MNQESYLWDQWINSAQVVVLASEVTDLNPIDDLLGGYCGLRIYRLGMASSQMRMRFESIKRSTQWAYLPQVFVDGRFIGGYRALREWVESQNAQLDPMNLLSQQSLRRSLYERCHEWCEWICWAESNSRYSISRG